MENYDFITFVIDFLGVRFCVDIRSELPEAQKKYDFYDFEWP